MFATALAEVEIGTEYLPSDWGWHWYWIFTFRLRLTLVQNIYLQTEVDIGIVTYKYRRECFIQLDLKHEV